MMNIEGKNVIGFSNLSNGTVGIWAINPTTGDPIPPLFFKSTPQECEKAVALAAEAFATYRKMNREKKSAFLDQIAIEIEEMGDTLLDRYTQESGLPRGRAEGERARTVAQIRLFAQLIKEGSWVRAQIDPADKKRKPLPKADIRSMEQAIGPVAVFGASNFPLAFSVAGGDTIAALAAGCPVVFKAHPAHLGTSELAAKAIQQAAQKSGMPDGIFSLLIDDAVTIGQQLVKHPLIKAVAFTGSFTGGKAIFDAAMARPEPIPVYAEMGSINPVFVLPEIIESKAEQIAEQFVAAVTLGVGQFCTNPGLLVVQKNQKMIAALQDKIGQTEGGVMLTKSIFEQYDKSVKDRKKQVALLGTGLRIEGYQTARPHVFMTDFATFAKKNQLHEEVFGPSSLVVVVQDEQEMTELAKLLKGQLTCSIHGTDEELAAHTGLIDILEQKAGRLVFNGFPTGVEVTPAMVHGGPFPATTDARSTSVGTQSIYRFTRRICYQDKPGALLPDELKDKNPLKIKQQINGIIA